MLITIEDKDTKKTYCQVGIDKKHITIYCLNSMWSIIEKNHIYSIYDSNDEGVMEFAKLSIDNPTGVLNDYEALKLYDTIYG